MAAPFLKHFSDLGTGSNTLKFKSSIIHLKDVAILTDIRIVFTNNKYLIMMETDANNNFGNLLLADNATQSVVGMSEMLAHEIKNPLTPMRLSVQHIEKSLQLNDGKFDLKLSQFSQSMISQIDTLARIANSFADFANVNKQKMFYHQYFQILAYFFLC